MWIDAHWIRTWLVLQALLRKPYRAPNHHNQRRLEFGVLLWRARFQSYPGQGLGKYERGVAEEKPFFKLSLFLRMQATALFSSTSTLLFADVAGLPAYAMALRLIIHAYVLEHELGIHHRHGLHSITDLVIQGSDCRLDIEVWIDVRYGSICENQFENLNEGRWMAFGFYVAWYGLHWRMKVRKMWDAKCY